MMDRCIKCGEMPAEVCNLCENKDKLTKAIVKESFENIKECAEILYNNCDMTEEDRNHIISFVNFEIKELGL